MLVNNFTKVLMVDYDESLLGALSVRLRQAGFAVDATPLGNDGYSLATNKAYDALILDTNIPGNNVFTICENLRARGILTPILFLSDRNDEHSTIHSLESGADDYIVKPFSHNELIARIKALVRRSNRSFATHWLSRHELDLDLHTNIAKYGDRLVLLTKKETHLLHRLMEETPEIISRERLLKDVWGVKEDHTSNRLDVYVRRLRDKLKMIEADHLVQTLRGSGYYFGPRIGKGQYIKLADECERDRPQNVR